MAYTRVTELDFDTIKGNLKDYLKNQSAFTDFDFDASNLQVLLDLLAYNTHYNAVLSNMVSNEMYLDTALKRSSVASLAKHLRYTPRSVRSAIGKVSVRLSNIAGTPTFLNIPSYTQFSTTVDGTPMTFFNRNSYTAVPNGSGEYFFPEVEIYEGRKLDFFYTVPANPTPATRYAIPNAGVDTTTIKVKVTEPSGAVNIYTQMNDITAANSTSLFYYLEENIEGFYEIFFGDGVLGYSPPAGSIVSLEYLISNGAMGNVSTTLAVTMNANSIAGEAQANRIISLISLPTGGMDSETVEQLRFNAIQRYTTNGRAVTANDYASIISAELPGAQSVNVWGGENNVPPVFGRVYISVKPKTGYVLTEFEKQRIVNDILRPRSVVTVVHEFVDPIYTFLNLEIRIDYQDGKTNKTAAEIAAQTNTTTNAFIDTNLERFNATYYQSQLQEKIMNLDDSILGVNIIVSLQKRIKVAAGQIFSGKIRWPSKLHPNQIRSNFFAYTTDDGAVVGARIRDYSDTMPPDYNGTGTLKIVNAATGKLLQDHAGTINYATGEMNITRLPVTGYLGASTDVRLIASIQETSQNITPGFDEILAMDDTTADVLSNLENGLNILVSPVVK
jgi:hypothetical protein